MAFCRNCGHEVHDTDNFCLYCGTATKDKTDNSSQSEQKRKESFDGEIKKCPYCGEILKSFETNCPTCGLELRNVSVANSVKELSNKIQLIEASKPRGKGIKSRICRAEIESQITNLMIDEIIEEAEKAGIKLVRPTEEPTTDSIPSSE